MTWVSRWWQRIRPTKPRPPDPVRMTLAAELLTAAHSLERAARAMKHGGVTPLLTTQTKTAATRAKAVVQQITGQPPPPASPN